MTIRPIDWLEITSTDWFLSFLILTRYQIVTFKIEPISSLMLYFLINQKVIIAVIWLNKTCSYQIEPNKTWLI